jgi:putative lipoic acid-binding regulatory protein
MAEPDESSEPAEPVDALFEFPCAFPLKIMGRADGALADAVLGIVRRHAPDFDGAVETRASSGGRYLSLSCTIKAVSRAQLDALYRELSGHPAVTVVL